MNISFISCLVLQLYYSISLDRMQEVSGPEEISDEELTGLSELEVFDKDRLKTLIEKVVVYGEDAMEIVWKVRSPFKDGKTA